MPEDPNSGKTSRRSFIDALLQGAAVLGLGGFVYSVVGFAVPPKETGGKEKEVHVGAPDEIKPGKARKFELNGKPALLIHLNGGFAALSAVCSHLGCIVDWDEDKNQVVCPCHNAVFDYNGNIVSGPPPLPLEKLDVTIRGNKIMVRKKG